MVTAATMMAAVGCSAQGGAGASTDVLHVTLANHAWTELITEQVPEFEKQTGVKVEFTNYGEEQLSAQYNVKLNAGDSSIDVMMYRPPSETRLYAQNKWLQDITSQVTGASDWDWNDFKKATKNDVSVDEVVYGVPLVTEQQVMFYRKDILADAGIEVPKTLDELEAAAKKLTRPGEFFGFVARGKQFSQSAPILHTFGGDWYDDNGATLNTPEAIKAYEYYGGMLRNYGPPGVTNMAWPEALSIFAQGKAAFYTDANVLYPNLTDPTKSTVADKVGFAVIPAGPNGSQPYNVTSWGLGINSNSKNQENAWKFIEWATSKNKVLSMQQEGLLGARTSVWENPEGLTGIPAELAEVTAASVALDSGRDRPDVVDVKKASEIYGEPITAAITGKDVPAAAEKANAKFNELLQNEKRRQ